MLKSLLELVTEDLYTRKKAQPMEGMKDPFEQFRRQHKNHHLITELRTQHQENNKGAGEIIMSRILREDWRGYLAAVQPSNITAIYKYVRKRDGREPCTFVHQCAAPLLSKDDFITSPKGKYALLAEYFQEKLTEPRQIASCEIRDTRVPRGKKKCAKPRERAFRGNTSTQDNPPAEEGAERRSSQNNKAFKPFREVEITKAVAELSGNKAAGPDNLPTDLFKHLPAITPLLTDLISTMVRTGNIPLFLRQVLLVPLDKPGKDNKLCSSKRPISLINTIIKIAESAVYYRIIHTIEPLYRPSHYAYRRSRGTNAHLTSLTGRMLKYLQSGDCVYLDSLDIQGAFDFLPHT